MYYKIKKVKIKDRSLTVDMNEHKEYLFNGKVAFKQLEMDFNNGTSREAIVTISDSDDNSATLEVDKKGKLKRSKKINTAEEAAA